MAERSLEELIGLVKPALQNPELVARVAVAALGSPTQANKVVLPSIKDEELTKAWRWLLVLARDSEKKYGVKFDEVLASILHNLEKREEFSEQETTEVITVPKTETQELKGISPTYDSCGLAGLHDCLFHGSWSSHPAGFPIILLGGWKDDFFCDETHHIQRICLQTAPPLDVARLIVPRTFPSVCKVSLGLQGAVLSDGKMSDISVKSTESRQWTVHYNDFAFYPDTTIFSMQQRGENRRFDRFDFINAVWFEDGRIFAESEWLVEAVLKLAKDAAVQSHGGGGPWKSLHEHKEYEKKQGRL